MYPRYNAMALGTFIFGDNVRVGALRDTVRVQAPKVVVSPHVDDRLVVAANMDQCRPPSTDCVRLPHSRDDASSPRRGVAAEVKRNIGQPMSVYVRSTVGRNFVLARRGF